MHLAVLACDGAILLDDHCRVVIETWGTALKEGSDDDDTEVFGEFAIEISGWTRDRFCKIEVLHIFYLTEVEGVVEFLQNDEFCATMSKVDDAFSEASLVVGNVCRDM